MNDETIRTALRLNTALTAMRRAITRTALATVLIAGVVTVGAAQDSVAAGVRIGLRYDGNGRPGIALLPVAGPNADSVRAMLARDLDYSDRINVIALDSADATTGGLNYDLYARMNATAVLQATVTPSGGLHLAVHGVADKRVVLVMDMPLPEPAFSRDWRHVVHVASDSVEWAVLGQAGISSTRIAFATRGGSLWVVDADGQGLQAIPGTTEALSPAWDRTGTRLAWGTTRVGEVTSHIAVRDFTTGQTWTTRAAATNLTPVFSPDGTQIVYAAGSDGFDLYVATPFTNDPPRRLTARRGSVNTSPTFSPDGRKIAFTSGILGHPEVYIMDADGSSPDLLTSSGFGDDLYRSNPSWSPDGRRVAFQSRIKGDYQVMTISVLDKSTTQLTSEGRNEDPSWAPDGRHIVFISNRTGSPQLWVMDTESSRARQLTHGGRAQDPAWSPRLGVSRQP